MITKDDIRQQLLYQWASEQLKQPSLPWEPLTGDASPRRYFRIEREDKTYLAVDSPNDVVDNTRFVALAWGLASAGLHVPTIYASDLDRGFLLVDELSRTLYSDVLTPNNADELYGDAMHALIKLQNGESNFSIPIYPWKPEEYYVEMTDMLEWLFGQHLQLSLTSTEDKALKLLFTELLENMEAQPQVCVHRDYHSRNLLYCAENNPGIIDFQDLFLGPITYDLVSLVRDAYVEWPWTRVERWIHQFYKELIQQPKYKNMSEAEFNMWFHGMSLQRGIKVLGRFARLCYRDKKPRYMADVPRVARYVMESCAHFSNTNVLVDVLNEKIMPALVVESK